MGDHRRDEVEIMHDVLEVCLKGVNKTRIVYSANLNFPRLNRYLRVLLGLGFLVKEIQADGSVFYKTASAGVLFFKGCSNIQRTHEKDEKKRCTHALKPKPV
jgi:predicted transcriptional regulator